MGCVTDGIDAEMNVRQCDMVIVETSHSGLEAVVITQFAVVPSQTVHFVDIIADIDVGFLGDGVAQVGVYMQRVAWQMDSQTGLIDAEAVGIDRPFVV